jgi:oxygen-independent coproporphyrinogen-3 oxidase
LEGFALEWERQRPLLAGYTIESVYFGGGTPSLLGPEPIRALLQQISPLQPGAEITLEANPEHADPALYAAYRAAGVNRVSLGVQSLDDRALATLERQHTARKAKEAIRAVKAAGIPNLSIDLMYDLPNQTVASWAYTLDQLNDLPIDHLSLYNLTIEPHTSFYRRQRQLTVPPPEESLKMLRKAIDALRRLGLERYEISAFAKPGFASRHNLGYWTYRPFLGFGPSAFSYWDGERFQNEAHLQRYAQALRSGQSPVSFREKLEPDAALKEQLAVQLRLLSGWAPPPLAQETQEAIERLQKQRWLVWDGPTLRLTEEGTLFYDSVAAELI